MSQYQETEKLTSKKKLYPLNPRLLVVVWCFLFSLFVSVFEGLIQMNLRVFLLIVSFSYY